MSVYYNVRVGRYEYLLPNKMQLQNYAIEEINKRHHNPARPEMELTATITETGQTIPLYLHKLGKNEENGNDSYLITGNETEKEHHICIEFETKTPIQHGYTKLRLHDEYSDITWDLEEMPALRCTIGDTWPGSIHTANEAINFLASKIYDCLSAVNNAHEQDPGECLDGAQTAAHIITTIDFYRNLKLTLEN